MAKYREIKDGELAVDAPITSELLTALRDNEIAYRESDDSCPNGGMKYVNYDPLPNAEAGEIPIYHIVSEYFTAVAGDPDNDDYDDPNIRFSISGYTSNDASVEFGELKIRRSGVYTGVLRADLFFPFGINLSKSQTIPWFYPITLGWVVNGVDTACKKLFRINIGMAGTDASSGVSNSNGSLNHVTQTGLEFNGDVALGGAYLDQQGFKANFYANAGDIVSLKVQYDRSQQATDGHPTFATIWNGSIANTMTPLAGGISGSLHVNQNFAFTQSMADASFQNYGIDTSKAGNVVSVTDGSMGGGSPDTVLRSHFNLAQVSSGHPHTFDIGDGCINMQDRFGSGVT